jgi:hypothetical protein
VDNHVQKALLTNQPTCSLLNPAAMAMDVPVGWRTSLSPCRFIKRLNQFLPVAPLTAENGLEIVF